MYKITMTPSAGSPLPIRTVTSDDAELTVAYVKRGDYIVTIEQDEFTIEPNVSDGTTCKYEIRNISLYEGLN